MTEEERRERKYLSQKKWRMKNLDRLLEVQRRNNRRRRSDPEYAARERERSRAYYAAHREQCLERTRKWRAKNAGRVLAYQNARKRTEAYRRKIARTVELRREKMKDPAYRAKIAAQQRAYRRKLHAEGRYAEFSRKTYLLAKWEKVAAAGREAIATYMKLARPENRRQFVLWYTKRNNLIDRTHGLGKVEARDGEERT